MVVAGMRAMSFRGVRMFHVEPWRIELESFAVFSLPLFACSHEHPKKIK
jgi:hypothetical protein